MSDPSFADALEAVEQVRGSAPPSVHSVGLTRDRGELCVRVNLRPGAPESDAPSHPTVRVVTFVMPE